MKATIPLMLVLLSSTGLVVCANATEPSDPASVDGKKISQLIFARIDADGDGALSQSEFEKGFEAASLAGAALIKALDANGDGELGPRELTAANAAVAALDDDSNGTISHAEMVKAAEMDSFDRQALRISLQIMRVDRDGDGRLSRDETPGRMKRNFRAIDRDGDQTISWGELKHRFGSLLRRGVKVEVFPQSAQGTALPTFDRSANSPDRQVAG